MPRLAMNFGQRAQRPHLEVTQVSRRASRADRGGDSASSSRLTVRLQAFRSSMDQTPRHWPQARQTCLIVSEAPCATIGFRGVNGPAGSPRASLARALANRSRHSLRILGFASCPTNTDASASIPGSCGTTITASPVGITSPNEANHGFTIKRQRQNDRRYGLLSLKRSQSWHSAQPERSAATASPRSSSASSAVTCTPAPVITAPSVPFSRMSISRARRDRQRVADALVFLRDRNETACAKAWALNRRVSLDCGIAAVSHAQHERTSGSRLRQNARHAELAPTQPGRGVR
jgi:hypothetical protein